MVGLLSRRQMQERINRQFLHTSAYEYPCDYAASKEESDFTIVINHRPDRDHLPTGTYQ